LDVKQCLVALNGSFLVVDGNPKEPKPDPADVTLGHVTTYLSDHLVLLRAVKEENKGRGLVLTQVKADDCLFASDGAKSFAHLDGVSDDKGMRDCFLWIPKNNAYSGFSPMLDQQPRAGEPAVPPFDEAKWKTLTRDEGQFLRVRFQVPPAPER